VSIKFKHYPISTTYNEVVLEGTIVYWSKDYKVILKQPMYKEGTNLHMMYMIPARFVTPLDSIAIKNVKDIDIVDASINKLMKLFSKLS
jgi:hypothetical protein